MRTTVQIIVEVFGAKTPEEATTTAKNIALACADPLRLVRQELTQTEYVSNSWDLTATYQAIG